MIDAVALLSAGVILGFCALVILQEWKWFEK
jgi:hypothetical protein